MSPQLERAQPSPDAQYHYCIVRRDIPVGMQMAQLLHAAGESPGIDGLRIGECNAVALGAKDEAELSKVQAQLLARQIPHRPIVETDGVHAGQLMAIGIAPGPRLEVLRWLPLVK